MGGRFCSLCGRQATRESCCWIRGPDGTPARPCPLISPPEWEEWEEDERFLIALLMETFGGAAEEWELLRRLPWSRWRLEEHVVDFEHRPEGAAEEFPCFRETDEKDRGRRYFLNDLARRSYELHRREVDALGPGFPRGRYWGLEEGPPFGEG